MHRFRIACFLWLLFSFANYGLATDGNRLTYLDEISNPYYVGGDFPKLTTPQWIGEKDVEAVVVLAIDDMRGHERWEAYLRPILERLKKIDGRAGSSIMTNRIDPNNPHLQKWLQEGVSLEVHTYDHPCPCLQGGDFAKAKETYERCVDMMAEIPGNKPVAFRMPCCDSLNTPSPRFWLEIFNKKTIRGNYLSIDSSVFNIITPEDLQIPREIALENGKPRFQKYLPFPSFVNTIDNYPYPYIIGRHCWEFPCVVPSDWEAQNIQQPNNPRTVIDMQAALDATVIKQGVYNFVYHPHGWIRNDQVVRLIDHSVKKHGQKVKFLNFRDCLERMNKNLLVGNPLRDSQGRDNGVRLIDVNNDGFLDVIIGNDKSRITRVWSPSENRWIESSFPLRLVNKSASGTVSESGVRFGVLDDHDTIVAIVQNEQQSGSWRFDGKSWSSDSTILRGLVVDGKKVYTSLHGRDQGVRLRDLDGDGQCELIAGGKNQVVFSWDSGKKSWQRSSFSLPEGTSIVDNLGRDAGLRFVDIDEDGRDDVIYSNETDYSLHLFKSMNDGWSKKIVSGLRGQGESAIPMIARQGTENGAWFAKRHLWVQNEDTHRFPDYVDRRSFDDLLSRPNKDNRSPQAGLRSIHLREGFQIEQVAAEPLMMDPVSLDWGGDGKLWVVEMADYPNGIDGKGKPGGRVRYLEDSDGDGKYDRSTLFLDGINFPTGVLAWRKGVIVTAAPEVFYAEDTDGDGKADKRQTLYRGFGEGNQQHRVNGLRRGLDNWIYLANGDSGGKITSIKTGESVDMSGRDLRLKPDSGEIDAQSGLTQFNRNRDDWGNWFGGNNSNPVWYYALQDHYLRRNPHIAAPPARVQISEIPGAAPVFPRSKTVARFNDFHTADRFTSACSPMIYRDQLFGEKFYGNFFVCEPVHNLVSRALMIPEGVSFSSRRADDEKQSEFLASDDNWFRPVTVRTGPDGALWIVDMYREVIEHPEWIPEDWQKRLDLRSGQTKGRIYRVFPIGKKPRPLMRWDNKKSSELVVALASPSGTQRDLIQQMLIWRAEPESIGLLEDFSHASQSPLGRIHALCTLDGLGALRAEVVERAMNDSHPGVRRHAIRLSEQLLNLSTGLGDALFERLDDTDPHVRLQLAYSLGQWKDDRSGNALAKLALKHEQDQFLSAAVMSSINKENIAGVLSGVLSSGGDSTASRRIVSRLLSLAASLGEDKALTGSLAVVSKATNNQYAAWQLQALSDILDVLNRRPESTNQLPKETKTRIKNIYSHALEMADNEKLDLSMRLAAVRLLGRANENQEKIITLLSDLLIPQNPLSMQSEAVRSLAQLRNKRVSSVLLANWENHSPPLRSQILDTLISRSDWTESLLSSIESGIVLPGHLDARRRQQLVSQKDEILRLKAEQLLSSSESSTREQVLAAHQDVLKMTGDLTQGKKVFIKRCSVCHRLEGVGFTTGPDLLGLTNTSPEAILTAIINPNKAVEDKFIDYTALTRDGLSYSGMLASESGTSITLESQEGKRQVILRNQLETLRSSGKSLMPEGLEKDLSKQDMADVIAYVASAALPKKNKPMKIYADTDGSLYLPASKSIIYGKTLVFEPKHQNLGFWQSSDDRAVWTLEAPHAGKYKIILDYACDDGTSGNEFIIRIDYQVIEGKVPGTGTWDDYKSLTVGEVPIRKGFTQLVLRPKGKLNNFLLDLRGVRIVPVGTE